jgi:hypothetical protein
MNETKPSAPPHAAQPAPEMPRPGWYYDPERPSASTMRYWTGTEWPTTLSSEQRQEALAGRVAWWVDNAVYRVESQRNQAVLVRGRRPNHLLHLILSVVTGGFWALFVWLPIAIFGGEKRKTVTVRDDGRLIES